MRDGREEEGSTNSARANKVPLFHFLFLFSFSIHLFKIYSAVACMT